MDRKKKSKRKWLGTHSPLQGHALNDLKTSYSSHLLKFLSLLNSGKLRTSLEHIGLCGAFQIQAIAIYLSRVLGCCPESYHVIFVKHAFSF
jgi:hypothetical protein